MRKCLASGFLLLCLAAACNSGERQLLDRAEAAWRGGRYDEAIRTYTLLYEHDHQGRYAARALLSIGNIYYLNLRHINDAVGAYSKLVDELAGRDEEVAARQQLAQIYANEIGDLTQAVSQYDRLLEKKDLENRTEILSLRANAYFKQNDFHRALREFRKLEEDGLTGHPAHLVFLKIGAIYQIQHKYQESIPYFENVATAACPECRRKAILDLAETYEYLYDFNRAIQTLQRLDANPENATLVAGETRRLEEKRNRVNITGELSWQTHR
jgi:tetratricopeptide (TPR) repeat protein